MGLIAATVVLSVASMLASAPRFENGRDLDSVIRKVRNGAQRDVGDAVDHHFEVADPIIVGISDGFSTLGRQTDVHAPPGAVMLPHGPERFPGPDTLASLYLVPPAQFPLLARPHTPSRGRAPPAH